MPPAEDAAEMPDEKEEAVRPPIPERLDPDPFAKRPPAPRQFEGRTWTIESTGQTFEAKLVKAGGGKATLEKEDGEKIVVAMDDLSDEDREWIRAQARKR